MSQVIVADRKYTCDVNRRSIITSSKDGQPGLGTMGLFCIREEL